jgi:hypothetical protein
MGTRAVILVTGLHWQGETIPETVRLYRHHDGDPSWTLKDIADGIRAAEKVCSAKTRRWADPRYDYTPARTVADCIIAASIGWGGADIRVDVDGPGNTKNTGSPAVYAQALGPQHYGDQADLEWAYVVDVRRKGITVYGGYGTVATLRAAGPQRPEVHLEILHDDYVPKVRRRIRAGMRALLKLGWAVNPAPIPVQKQAAVRRA